MLKPKLRQLLDRLLLIPALVLVIGPVQTAAAAAIGGGEYYVSGAGNDKGGDGTEGSPWRTITHAVSAAGGGAPTIHVLAGTYSQFSGEAFPILIDDADDLGVYVVGPGDGSATVVAADIVMPLGGGKGGGGGETPTTFLKASDYIDGEVIVSGLIIAGGTTAMAVVGIPTASVLDLDGGAASVSILDNQVFNHGLLTWDFDNNDEFVDQTILIENNTVVDGWGDGVDLDYEVYISSSDVTSSGSFSLDIAVRGNTFIGIGDDPVAVSVYGSIDASTNVGLQVDVLVENNQITDCGGGIGVWTDLYGSDVDASQAIIIRNNELVDCADGASMYFYVSWEDVVVNRTIEITNNTISLTDETGVNVATYVDTSIVFDGDVLVSGNDFIGGEGGIDTFYRVAYSDTLADRDVVISNNSIRDADDFGIKISTECRDSDAVGDIDFVIDGNTIRNCGGRGIGIMQSAESSNTSTFGFLVTKNLIEGCPVGVSIEVECSSGVYDYSYQLRGNVITGFSETGGSPLVGIETHLMQLHASGDFDLTLDGGGALLGYNTFSPSPMPHYDSLSMIGTESVNADLNLNGNWWGTTDPTLIEDIVFHGADVSSSHALAIVDFSQPLPDEIDFSVSQPGSKIKLTAGGASGFVPYAGDIDIVVEVNGSAANNVVVADDYGSLTFDNDYSGSVEICVTNPGGQSGCLTSTVTASSSGGGGGGGGCGIIPVDGGPPTAKQLAEQYLLLLLPALFLLRRRMRGVRPQPVGYAA